MSDWGVETVERCVVRRAGAQGGPALRSVHALGDSNSAFLPLLSSRLCLVFELLAPDLPGAGHSPIETRPVDLDALAAWLARAIGRRSPTGSVCSRSFRGGHWPMVEDPDATADQIASFFEPLMARHRPT